MRTFDYKRADTIEQATSLAASQNTSFIAGGTNFLDLMKLEVLTPDALVDINRLDLHSIEQSDDGGLRIGALVPWCPGALVPWCPTAYWLQIRRYTFRGAVARLAVRSISSVAQQGHHRRQSVTANALLLLLRHSVSLQQAKPRQWLQRIARAQPIACHIGCQRTLHRDSPQ